MDTNRSFSCENECTSDRCTHVKNSENITVNVFQSLDGLVNHPGLELCDLDVKFSFLSFHFHEDNNEST